MIRRQFEKTSAAVLVALTLALLAGSASGFPHWRFDTELEWEPVGVLGVGIQPHRGVGVGHMLQARELLGFNEITGNLTRQFPIPGGPLIFNSLRPDTFTSDPNGYESGRDNQLWRYFDARHFGRYFNLAIFNRVLVMDGVHEDDPDDSAIHMFLDDRSRVFYKHFPSDPAGVWRPWNYFDGSRLETSSFPEGSSTLITPNGTRMVFEKCPLAPMSPYQLISSVTDRFGNQVSIVRATKDCLPTHIIESTLDSPDDRVTYLEYNHKDDEPAELTTLKKLVMDSGTDDETHFYFKYESDINFLGFNPPRLTEIRFGPSDESDPQNQMMMCLYYVPLAEWGDSSGWILRYVQGPFLRGDFLQCDFHTLMEAQMGPIVEYSFDKNGRLKEVQYPGRYLYSVHYRDNQVQVSRAWHMGPDEHQDCCHGVLRPEGAGTKCDPVGPDQPDAFDNPVFCPLRELTVLTATIEGSGFEAQVARIDDNYGRWTTYERDDPWGHATRITTHDGQVWDLRYDGTMAGRHLPVEVTDPYGRRTRVNYDDWGHVIMEEPGDGTEIRTEYYLDGPGDPGWAFGTPKKITRTGDAGWREGLDSDDVVEETTFVAGQAGGQLVVEQFSSGSANPIFSEKMTLAGHVLERTSHQLGLTSVFEKTSTLQTVKWREESTGKEGFVNSFNFSGAGKLKDIQGPFFSASIGYTPDGRIASYNSSGEKLQARFHRWGMIESVESGTRATVQDVPDPSNQDRTDQIGEFDCNGLPVRFDSMRSGTRSGGSGWGMTYESPRECRVTEATEEEVGMCTVPQEERDECGYGQNLHSIGYSDGFCEKINNNVSTKVCDCIRRCECDASSYDIYTQRYTLCYPARLAGERECLDEYFYEICN